MVWATDWDDIVYATYTHIHCCQVTLLEKNENLLLEFHYGFVFNVRNFPFPYSFCCWFSPFYGVDFLLRHIRVWPLFSFNTSHCTCIDENRILPTMASTTQAPAYVIVDAANGHINRMHEMKRMVSRVEKCDDGGGSVLRYTFSVLVTFRRAYFSI